LIRKNKIVFLPKEAVIGKKKKAFFQQLFLENKKSVKQKSSFFYLLTEKTFLLNFFQFRIQKSSQYFNEKCKTHPFY